MAGATAAQVRGAAVHWLSDGDYTLEVRPFPDYATAPTGADRSKLPEPGPPPKAEFPALERATLSNGLKIVLAQRPSIPQVRIRPAARCRVRLRPVRPARHREPGDEHARRGHHRPASALEISDRLADLGATLGTASRLDVSSVSLEALTGQLGPSLELFADVILHPAFRPADLERLRKQRLAQIQREKADPVGMALRVFPRVVYGEGHAYGNPWTGTGTEASTAKITRADLVKFHQTWFKPNHATLIVTGATSMAEIRPRLERLFAGWTPGDVPQKNIAAVAPKAGTSVYLLDRPGALQTVLIAGDIAPPKANPDEPAIETMGAVLGSDFGSRINMNLREDKHWSYGAFSSFATRAGRGRSLPTPRSRPTRPRRPWSSCRRSCAASWASARSCPTSCSGPRPR